MRAFAAPTDLDEAAFIVDVVKGLADDGVALDRDRAALPQQRAVARARARAVQRRRCRTACTAACASSSAPRSSTRSPTCGWSPTPGDDGAFLRVVNFPAARHRRALARAAAGRARGARHDACGRRRRAASSAGKAGTALAAFVRLIEALRDATRGAAAARSGRARHRGVGPRARTTGRRRTARTASRTCEELVNAADGFVREADLADRCADARRSRRRPTRRSPADGRARRRDRSADGVPRARRARGGRHAGGRGPAGAAADDGALGEGPRVPHGVRHRPRGRPVPAREQPATRPTASRRSGGSCTSRITRARRRLYLTHAQSRMLHGQTRYNIASRFVDEIPRELVQWLSPQRAPRRSTSTTPSGAAIGAPRRTAQRAAAPGVAHRPERAPRQVRRRRDHRRRRPRQRRARAGQLPRRRRQVARARVREARSRRSELRRRDAMRRADVAGADQRRERLARVEHVAIAHVVGDVQRRDEEEHVGQQQRQRERAPDRRRQQQREQRRRRASGSSAAEEEHARARRRSDRPPVRERRAQARARAPSPALASWNTTSAGAHHSASSVGSAHSAREQHRRAATRGRRSVACSAAQRRPRSSVRGAGAGTAGRAACRRRPAPSRRSPTVMPTTKTTPSGSSARRFDAEALEQLARRRGVPPRSCVHAAARKPTANTGFSIGAASAPMNGIDVDDAAARRNSASSSTSHGSRACAEHRVRSARATPMPRRAVVARERDVARRAHAVVGHRESAGKRAASSPTRSRRMRSNCAGSCACVSSPGRGRCRS